MRGFVKIRRGIIEHLLAGVIGFLELAVYLIIHLQADYRTGVWTGSAPRLMATAPRGAKLRVVQRALERLAEIGFIRIFRTRGRRGNYRVLIHKYEPNIPALKGKRLNAFKSPNWQDLVFEPCAENDADDDTDTDTGNIAEDAPYKEVRKKKQEKEPKRVCAGKRARIPAAVPARFPDFWNRYPRQINEREAIREFGRLSDAEQSQAIESLDTFKTSENWLKDGGDFVPSPHKFLRDRRFQNLPLPRKKGNVNGPSTGKSASGLADPFALAEACGLRSSGTAN